MPVSKLTPIAQTFLKDIETSLGTLPDSVQKKLAKAGTTRKPLDIVDCATILLQAMPSLDHARLITSTYDSLVASTGNLPGIKGSRLVSQIASAMTPKSSTSRSAASAPPAKIDFTLDVVYVGDSHSNMSKAARAATIFKTAAQLSKNTIAVHTGDAFVGTPLFEVGGHGVAEMQILKEMGIQYFVPGNHDLDEGDLPLAKALKAHSKMEVLAANWKVTGPLEKIVKPYTVREIDGHRVAIIGISTNPADYGFKKKTVTYENPAVTLRQLIPAIKAKENTSSIIVISHLGSSVDKELAGYFPEVDAWIGGHSHTTMRYPDRRTHEDGSTSLVAHAGSNFDNVGLLALGFKNGRLAARSGTLMPVNDTVKEDAGVSRILAHYKDKLEEFGEVLATSKVVISGKSRGGADTRLGNLVTDVIREELSLQHKKIDIAIFNRTGLRASLPRGEITLGNLFELFPFSNTLCTVELTGEQVQQMLNNSASRGGDAVSGVTYAIKQGKATDIKVGGKALARTKTYTIAANSYMVRKGGSGYGIFGSGKNIIDTNQQIRELLIGYFRKNQAIDPPHVVEVRTKVSAYDSGDAIRSRLGITPGRNSRRRAWYGIP